MFTGIIEELGVVTSFIRSSHSGKLTVSAGKDFARVKTGESIAVNGVCLTATGARRTFIEFDVSPETIRRSSLHSLKIGEKVNLEKALLLSSRLGGHLVTGHVDGVGEVKKKVKADAGFELYVSVPSDLLRYLVPKGSITLDGVSLTIADLRDGLVIVSVVPHTAKATNLELKRPGDVLNIEVDVLSKYIEKHLRSEVQGITEDSMMKMGYLPMSWSDN